MVRSTGDMAFSARTAPHPGTAVKRAASSKWVKLLERVGYIARGILYVVMGSLALGLALGIGGKAMHHDPSKVKGFAGTFELLLSQPYGHLLLGLVALGSVALGLHSFAAARWMRLLGSRR